MHIQRSLLIVCFVLSSICLVAQKVSFEQSFGLSGGSSTSISKVADGQIDTTMVTSTFSVKLLQFGIVYYPRVEFLRWKGGSLSIGSPVMAGFSISTNYRSADLDRVSGVTTQREGISGVDLAFTLPVVVDLNIGLHSAAEESRQHLGLYVGAGYGYSYNRIKTSSGKVFYDGFDPVFRGGLRFGGAWENRFTLGFNVRGMLQGNSARIYELHLLKDL